MLRQESDSYRDLVARMDALDPIEELSLLLHPWWDEDRFMGFMICSYADESGDQRPGVYSVCGLIGKHAEFVELERQWRHALDDEGIPEFHAAKLENHLAPYGDLKFDFDRRSHLQRRFIGIITERALCGFNAFAEIKALQIHADRLRPFFSDSAVKPYTFTFRMFVEIAAIEIDEYKKPAPIAFVFDQQKEHEGKAKEIYDDLSRGERNWPLADRLGSISFQSRLEYVALQAADAWAYESRKHVADALYLKQPERWQFTMFKTARHRFGLNGYREEELLKLIARLERGEDVRPTPSSARPQSWPAL
jgi:hypothetical protein